MDTHSSIREKKHRLRPEMYRGPRSIAFTACVQSRQPVLIDPEVAPALIDRLEEAASRHRCTVPLFTLMPDHLHVLLLGESESSDGKAAMDRFKASSGWWFYRNRPDVKWQKGYWDHVVREREGWEVHARYLAQNPVRAGLVEDPLDWPFTGSIGYDVREVVLDAHW